MSSPKKTRTTTTTTKTMEVRTSFADYFLDQREKVDIAIDLKKADLAVENLSQTLIAVN